MAKIPLNYFRRIGTPLSATSVKIYEVPYDRAGIILTALATNATSAIQTVTVQISTNKAENGITLGGYNTVYLVRNSEIGAYDVGNLIIGKVVLTAGDALYANCSALTAVSLNLSILEAVNTQ